MPRILVADGDPVERELLRDVLAGAGHEPLAARDGEEALALAERERPALALLDVLLPHKDGYTVLLHLRARDATRDLPVVFLSSEPAEEHAGIATSLGAAAYLGKPWSGEDLLAAIDEAIAHAGRRGEGARA